MGLYVGEISIPFVSEFSTDNVTKNSEVVKHLGNVPHHLAEFKENLNTLKIEGTLLQVAGTVKTLIQLSEDFGTLARRFAPYNFVYNFQGRSGWCSIGEALAPEIADTAILRSCSASGYFLDDSEYQARMHTLPVIRSNPWSHVLGTDDCDNYVAIPIGSTYSGGDGSSKTRVGEDGTITLVLATTLKDIKYDIGQDDIDNGEVKIWDEMGTATEANWIKVFSPRHKFTGKIVIQNSLYRIVLDAATEYISVYRYSSGWTKIDDFTSSAFTRGVLTSANPDQVICTLDNGDIITVRRGHPILIDTNAINLVAIALTPAEQSTSTDNYLFLDGHTLWAASTAYVLADTVMPSTANGYYYECTVAGTSAATEPTWPTVIDNTVVDGTVTWKCKAKMVIYICSDANFSIVKATKNLGSGKKWIFYETVAATAEDIAHQALVLPNLRREIIAR